jgi:hypothetical protein
LSSSRKLIYRFDATTNLRSLATQITSTTATAVAVSPRRRARKRWGEARSLAALRSRCSRSRARCGNATYARARGKHTDKLHLQVEDVTLSGSRIGPSALLLLCIEVKAVTLFVMVLSPQADFAMNVSLHLLDLCLELLELMCSLGGRQVGIAEIDNSCISLAIDVFKRMSPGTHSCRSVVIEDAVVAIEVL